MHKWIVPFLLFVSMLLAGCDMLDWEHHHLPDSMKSLFESTTSTFGSPICQYNTCIE